MCGCAESGSVKKTTPPIPSSTSWEPTCASPPSGPDAQAGPKWAPSPSTDLSIAIVELVPVSRKHLRMSECALTKSCIAGFMWLCEIRARQRISSAFGRKSFLLVRASPSLWIIGESTRMTDFFCDCKTGFGGATVMASSLLAGNFKGSLVEASRSAAGAAAVARDFICETTASCCALYSTTAGLSSVKKKEGSTSGFPSTPSCRTSISPSAEQVFPAYSTFHTLMSLSKARVSWSKAFCASGSTK
mmetsp:Transcript_39814/g.93036  ORF Transcript_39814/g.93036 Transcript_39814/m.93036 type:complete len:246 (-) Transcript_39814:606-1343(-)